MLHIAESYDGEPRLILRSPALSAEAWIEPARSYTSYPGADWVLWYRLPNRPACAHKSQLRLEIESALRAWLLRAHRRRLYAMSFRELCDLTLRTRSGRPSPSRFLPR